MDSFIPEDFWRIVLEYTDPRDNTSRASVCATNLQHSRLASVLKASSPLSLFVQFLWKRSRLYDRDACEALFQLCVDAGTAVVTNVCAAARCALRYPRQSLLTMAKLKSNDLSHGSAGDFTPKEQVETASSHHGRDAEAGLPQAPHTL